ncbi:hypothetical protein H9P43_004374 [Blastocladiella emersonii ATCC 22665]|nr:hypothetical protein H9P43_004374 [Blastocladiella emersonii ATCC 22665]
MTTAVPAQSAPAPAAAAAAKPAVPAVAPYASAKTVPRLESAEVTVAAVRNLKKSDHLFGGKNDPYVILKWGGKEVRTATQKGAGADATFNETFNLDLAAAGATEIRVEVYDDDKLSRDDLIGEVTLSADKLIRNGNADMWLTLTGKKGAAGEIHLVVYPLAKLV